MNGVHRNSERYDLTDRVIHFFRPLDQDSDSAPQLPEDFGHGNLVSEDANYRAIFLTRLAIRNLIINSSWSIRNNAPTIYGPDPAVCFTDMPLMAFLESSISRERRDEKISSYGISIRKDQIFRAGARPVIYGLSGENISLPETDRNGRRIFDESVLPPREQYRYVTYNPTGEYPVDWTHEREWRWPDRNSLYRRGGLLIDETSETLFDPGHQLSLEERGRRGLHLDMDGLSDMGVIVKTDHERDIVRHDILALIDLGKTDQDRFSFILPVDRILDKLRQSNMGLDVFRDFHRTQRVIQRFREDLRLQIRQYLTADPDAELQVVKSIQEIANTIEASGIASESAEPGQAWLWLFDNFDPNVRALANGGQLEVNGDYKYLYPVEMPSDWGLRQKEEFIKQLAEEIQEKMGTSCGYYSVLGHDDIDGRPFYCPILPDEYRSICYNQP